MQLATISLAAASCAPRWGHVLTLQPLRDGASYQQQGDVAQAAAKTQPQQTTTTQTFKSHLVALQGILKVPTCAPHAGIFCEQSPRRSLKP